MPPRKKTCRKIKIKGYWKFDGIIPRYVKGYTKEVCIRKKKGRKRKYDY